MILARWFRRWRQRRWCFHHDIHTKESYIRSELVDIGRSKLFWCSACGRTF